MVYCIPEGGTPHLSEWIQWRLNNKRNAFVAITGESQSGKTSMAIMLCKATFENFNIDQIAFTPERFLYLLSHCPNSAIVLEDAGVGWGNRNWESKTSRAITYAVQTCGLNHQLIILTAPSFWMIDANARRQLQLLLEMRGRGFAAVHRIKENRHSHELFFAPLEFDIKKYPADYARFGHDVVLKTYKVDKPQEEMFSEFERRKREYLDSLYSGLISGIKSEVKSKKHKGKRPNKSRNGEPAESTYSMYIS